MKILKDIYKRLDDRGTFVECINGNEEWKSINGGFMNKGSIMGNHFHKRCKTYFFLLSGSADVYAKKTNDQEKNIEHTTIHKYEGVIFEQSETHAWQFKEDSTFLLLKSEKYISDDPDTHKGILIT